MAWQERRRLLLDEAMVWGEPGGSYAGQSVVHEFEVDALANGSAWQGDGVKLDPIYSEYLLFFSVETGTAPTAGNTVDLYAAWGFDDNGVAKGWPYGVTGTDGSFTAANRTSLGNPLPLVLQNAGNTVIPAPARLVVPMGEWFAPVLYNGSGQAIRNETTDADNDSVLILVPFVREFIEVA